MKPFSLVPQNNLEKHHSVESKLIGEFGDSSAKPLFTVFIPTFKRKDLLSFSFEKAYLQSGEFPYEVVICDNDDNLENLESFQAVKTIVESRPRKNVKVRYYKNTENLGQIGNWNRGIELARGRFLLMCHDDDWIDDDILESSLKYLGQNDGVAFKIKTNDFRKKTSFKAKLRKFIVWGATCFSKLFFSKKTKPLSAYDIFIRYMNPGNCGVVFKTDLLKEMGGYDDEVFPFTDLQLYARYALSYKLLYVKKRKAHYRIAANESLKAAKTFPSIRFDFMTSLIPFVKGYSQDELYEIAICVCSEYLRDASVFWGIPISEFAPFSKQIEVNPKRARAVNRKINVAAARRYL